MGTTIQRFIKIVVTTGICVSVASLTSPAASAQQSCWEDAAYKYSVDPLLLKAIAWTESRGFTGALGPVAANGHRAYGLMQIYSVHLPFLRLHGIEKEDLFDPCVSIHVGAYILSDCIQKFGNTWKAVGCYNTGPASKNVAAQLRYVSLVRRHYAGYLANQSLAQNDPSRVGYHTP